MYDEKTILARKGVLFLYLKVAILAVYAIVIYGLTLPSLISAKSDILVWFGVVAGVSGLVGIVAMLVDIVGYYKRLQKELSE